MNCKICNEVIPEGRLKAVSGTETCTAHSTTQRWYVRNILAGKTEYLEHEVIKDPVLAKKLHAMDRRSGYRSNLIKV